MSTTPPHHVLHSAADVLSARHTPSWMALALAAGATNAGAFLASERFVTHVTGTVTRVGLDGGRWALMGEYALVVGFFIFGAFLSVLAVQGRVARGRAPLAWVALAVVTGVLFAVALAGHSGLFGPLGGAVEEPADFALLSGLALAMGLMNATVASTTALSVRTTHMTGPATDVGVSLGVALFSGGAERTRALQLAGLRGGKLVAFSLGAFFMVELVARQGFLAFVAPALLIATATARSYLTYPDAGETPVVHPATP